MRKIYEPVDQWKVSLVEYFFKKKYKKQISRGSHETVDRVTLWSSISWKMKWHSRTICQEIPEKNPCFRVGSSCYVLPPCQQMAGNAFASLKLWHLILGRHDFLGNNMQMLIMHFISGRNPQRAKRDCSLLFRLEKAQFTIGWALSSVVAVLKKKKHIQLQIQDTWLLSHWQ